MAPTKRPLRSHASRGHLSTVASVSCRSKAGQRCLETPMTAPDPSTELMRLINGYQVSQAMHVAATLGVADQLKDGPKSYNALAQACGAHPTSLYRLLRA